MIALAQDLHEFQPFSPPGDGEMYTRPFTARFFANWDGKFRSVRNSNVLIYWPHGFGDWVFLSYVLPLLEGTNRYWITRFGDDFVSLMEGNEWASPLYAGTGSPHCDHGGAFNNRDFGLDLGRADGNHIEVNLPLAIHDACVKHQIDTIVLTNFPETYGFAEYPFHSKARNIARDLAPREHFDCSRMDVPLPTTINFEVPPCLTRWVEARLGSHGGFGERKLCLISRTGYTSTGKNWGHLWREEMPLGKQKEGEECRDFMRLMLQHDPDWMFLTFEDSLLPGDHTLRDKRLNSYSYAELFNPVSANSMPFGLMMKALVNLADLAIGVPAGPFHLCMAKRELPTVGIWTGHFPSWYDEPKPGALHILSRNVKQEKWHLRPGSFERRDHLHFRVMWSDSNIITGEQAMAAVQDLFY